MDDYEERIRRRAHEIWEQEGRQDGHQATHWDRAEKEAGALEVEQANKDATQKFRGSDAASSQEGKAAEPPSYINPD